MDREFVYLDSQLGSRYILAFHAKAQALQKRVRGPWVIGLYQGAYRMVEAQSSKQPNLFVVFNDLMLNLQTDGTPKPDPMPRYVGFNIPVANPETSETGVLRKKPNRSHAATPSSQYSWCSPPSTGFFLTRKEAETLCLSPCQITGRPGAGSGKPGPRLR